MPFVVTPNMAFTEREDYKSLFNLHPSMPLTIESPKIEVFFSFFLVFLFETLFILSTFLFSVVRKLFEVSMVTLFSQTFDDEGLPMLGTSTSWLFVILVPLSLLDFEDFFDVGITKSCFSFLSLYGVSLLSNFLLISTDFFNIKFFSPITLNIFRLTDSQFDLKLINCQNRCYVTNRVGFLLRVGLGIPCYTE